MMQEAISINTRYNLDKKNVLVKYFFKSLWSEHI